MKKILSLAVALFSALGLMASVNTLNYQAVINTPDGSPVSEKEIGMCFSIVNGNDILLTEETVVKSSAGGLVEWQVGSTLNGGLSAIDWSVSGLMLQVGIDLNGGNDYSSVYSSTIQSVPVAMYAERSGDTNELRVHVEDVINYFEDRSRNLEDFDNFIMVRCDENSAMIESLRKYTEDGFESVYIEMAALKTHLINEIMELKAQVVDLQSQVDNLSGNK